MKFIAYYDSPLGKIMLTGDEAGLCGLWFEGEKYYAYALAASSTDGKFCARDIAAKTDAAAGEGCYEKSGALETKSGADKRRSSTDLLAKEQRAASETQRDFAALKKSNITAKAANSADGKFCAHTLIASEKFFTRDFAAQDAGKKSRATNLSAQGGSGNFCANEQSGYFEEKT